jgi:hypothetical protein
MKKRELDTQVTRKGGTTRCQAGSASTSSKERVVCEDSLPILSQRQHLPEDGFLVCGKRVAVALEARGSSACTTSMTR